MTKTGKRILALIVLILVVILVGCLLYTGNRLNSYPDTIEIYKRMVFKGNDGTMVAFTEEQVWYGAGGGEILLLDICDYQDGKILLKKEEKTYAFIAVDDDVIYDVEREIFLIRRTGSG